MEHQADDECCHFYRLKANRSIRSPTVVVAAGDIFFELFFFNGTSFHFAAFALFLHDSLLYAYLSSIDCRVVNACSPCHSFLARTRHYCFSLLQCISYPFPRNMKHNFVSGFPDRLYRRRPTSFVVSHKGHYIAPQLIHVKDKTKIEIFDLEPGILFH